MGITLWQLLLIIVGQTLFIVLILFIKFKLEDRKDKQIFMLMNKGKDETRG